jgi:Holliday junction resolvase RusA-like endonuclease
MDTELKFDYRGRRFEKFVIAGAPIPKAEPQRNGYYFYDPNSKLKAPYIHKLMVQLAQRSSFREPVHLYIKCYIRLPKNEIVKKDCPLHGKFNDRRPDLDNYAKWIGDRLTDAGVLVDDNIVSSIYAEKVWVKEDPRTEITVRSKYARKIKKSDSHGKPSCYMS